MNVVRAIAIAIATLAAAPRANADPAPDPKRAPVGDGMILVVDGGGLFVERGALRASVPTGGLTPDAFETVDVDCAARQVTVELETCGADSRDTFTFTALEARLAFADGQDAYGKRAWPAAATAFAHAAALDPTLRDAAILEAAALAHDAKLDDAAAALAPWIAIDPDRVYVDVASNPELAPLRAHAAITRLRAPARGDVRFDRDGAIVGGIAYSAHAGAFAVIVQTGNESCETWSIFELVDAKTGAVRMDLPAAQISDADAGQCDTTKPSAAARAAVRKRAGELQALLRDLGYAAVASEQAAIDRADSGAEVARLPKHHLGVASDGATANLLRGNAVLASAPVMSNLHAIWYVGAAGAVLVESGRAGSETCGADQLWEFSVLPAPSP